MSPRTLAVIVIAALLTGCAGEAQAPPLAADDPANPNAPESPIAPEPPPLVLQVPPDAPDNNSPADHAVPGGAMKDMQMQGMDHSATRPTTKAAIFTCKMHPQVVSDHPGNCPICGMKLVPVVGAK